MDESRVAARPSLFDGADAREPSVDRSVPVAGGARRPVLEGGHLLERDGVAILGTAVHRQEALKVLATYHAAAAWFRACESTRAQPVTHRGRRYAARASYLRYEQVLRKRCTHRP